jgi:hypothetical protein
MMPNKLNQSRFLSGDWLGLAATQQTFHANSALEVLCILYNLTVPNPFLDPGMVGSHGCSLL